MTSAWQYSLFLHPRTASILAFPQMHLLGQQRDAMPPSTIPTLLRSRSIIEAWSTPRFSQRLLLDSPWPSYPLPRQPIRPRRQHHFASRLSAETFRLGRLLTPSPTILLRLPHNQHHQGKSSAKPVTTRSLNNDCCCVTALSTTCNLPRPSLRHLVSSPTDCNAMRIAFQQALLEKPLPRTTSAHTTRNARCI
ncbi:hypothetical protein IF1G_04514 [Cordyceps javanica]|uniref:Uncharacterized protein n=1 Tax=Cordyceps javanica TaxID=43265 RepID=A0A545V6E3_9HYPO|nr:hypothetical protein IF1G_04514 [Cordyceps javanica]